MTKDDTKATRDLLDLPSLGISDVLMMGRYTYSEAQPPLKQHTHGNAYEICVLSRGHQKYVLNDQEYKLFGGDIFVTKPYEPHGTGNAPEEPGSLYWIEIRGPSEGKTFLSLSQKDSKALFGQLNGIEKRVFRGGTSLIPQIDKVFSVYKSTHTTLKKANLQNLLLRLVFDVIDLSQAESNRSTSRFIQLAFSYIDNHSSEAIGIKKLSKHVGLSESYFKALFKKEVGLPPAEYITRLRIDSAREMLLTSDTKITELAHSLGFCSSQHFSAVFKRHTNMTPREYRKKPTRDQDATPVTGAGIHFHPTDD